MRLAFMGTPEFAVPSLAELIASGHEIVAVWSQPPRPRGRGQKLTPSPVHAFAEAMGLPVFTPESMKSAEAIEIFQSLDLDAACVVAYGQILKAAVLEAPRLGCFNLHGSLLPRWRGAAPIQRAIMAGATLWTRALAAIERGGVTETSQTGEPTYARKITPAEARIDWNRPAAEVDCHIRGLSPFPGAWFAAADGARVKALMSHISLKGTGAPGEVLDDDLLVACGEGAVRLTRVQREGRAAQPAADLLKGFPLPAGTLLG
jgi:methionyl-tRNA formyltransferase